MSYIDDMWKDMDILFQDDTPYPEGGEHPQEINLNPALRLTREQCNDFDDYPELAL